MRSADYVLVVDDEEELAEVIVSSLQEAGYHAVRARHGLEGLEAVAKRLPVLILLDMMMPVMDGWEFARLFRARHGQAVPIIVITAAERADACARETGANDYLAKPFDLRKLLTKVARYHPPRSASHHATSSVPD
jgi:urea transport system substrate-binding protein